MTNDYALNLPVGIIPTYDTPSRSGRPRRHYKTPSSLGPSKRLPRTLSSPDVRTSESPSLHPASQDHLIDPDWCQGLSIAATSSDHATVVTHLPSTPFARGETWAHEMARATEDNMNRFAASQRSVDWSVCIADNLDLDEMAMSGVTVTKEALRRSTADAITRDPRYLHTEESLLDLPRLFDREQDYTVKSVAVSSMLHLEWIGTPGLRPFDIRARNLQVRTSPKTSNLARDRVLFRAVYKCNGTCQLDSTSEEPDHFVNANDELHALTEKLRKRHRAAADALYEEDEEDDEANGDSARSQTHTCTAMLLVHITVAQAQRQQCSFWRMSEAHHPRPDNPRSLRISPYIRNLLHTMAGQFGQTAASLSNWYHAPTSEQVNPHIAWVKANEPHRGATERDFLRATRNVAKQRRHDSDPLKAIESIARRHPEAFIHFSHAGIISPNSMEDKDKAPLMCIIAPAFGLDMAILYSIDNGLGMDTSWRNKNAHRAPMTVLSTVDAAGRMLPVAVLVSQQADKNVYGDFLRRVKAQVVARAQELAKGFATPALNARADPECAERLLNNALIIAEEEDYSPAGMMIDGDESERLAIDTVWPRIATRVCQFHMMQACKSKLTSIFGNSPRGKQQVLLALEAIRSCQRCPLEEEWLAYVAQLRRKIENIAGADRANDAWQELQAYLLRTWFSARWRRYSVDFAMPGTFFREGPWSTNNYVEVCFRIFDRIMLEGRANKRLDRLIVVIIQVFFPYYENLRFNQPRPTPGLVRQIFTGLDIWQGDDVEEVPPGDASLPTELRHNVVKAFLIRAPTGIRVPCGILRNGRWICPCRYFNQTGSRCSHLFAAQTLDLCGSVTAFDTELRVVECGLRLRRRSLGDDTENDTGDLSLTGVDDPLFGLEPCEDDCDFWNEDITAPEDPARPRLSVLNTLAHQIPVSRMDEQLDDRFHQTSSRRILSQQARRHPNEDRAEDNNCESPADAFCASTPTYITGFAHQTTAAIPMKPNGGRPANIVPKQPSRAKKHCRPQPSTIGQSLKRIKRGERDSVQPIGAHNTGTDCYALALFQIFVASAHLRKAVLLIPPSGSESDTPSQLLRQFIQASSQPIAGHFPEIRATLQYLFLSDRSRDGQRDPVELLTLLIPHLDASTGSERFQSLFEYKIRARVQCPQCHQWQHHTASAGEQRERSISRIYPLVSLDATVRRRTRDTISRLLCESVRPGQEQGLGIHCHDPSCHHDFRVQEPSMEVWTPQALLAINIVWNRAEDGSTLAITEVELEHSVAFGKEKQWSSISETQSVTWSLKAVVKRTTAEIARSHYVAIVRREERWFHIDDHIVRPIISPAHDLDIGGAPVLLLYERDGLSESDTALRSTPQVSAVASAKPDSRPHIVDGDAGQLRFNYINSLAVSPACKTLAPAWCDRYHQLSWSARDCVDPMIHCTRMSAMPPIGQEDVDLLGPVFERIWHQARQMPTRAIIEPQDMSTLLRTDSWWSNFHFRPLINLFAEALGRRTTQKDHDKLSDRPDLSARAEYVESLLCFHDRGGPGRLVGHPGEPLARLSGTTKERSLEICTMWRTKRIVSIISSKRNTHWIVIVIFGPQRLVAVYDTVAGSSMDPVMESAIHEELQARLDWEASCGYVNAEANEGWIVTPNDATTLDQLKWVKQTDSFSCGPLAVAACALLLQGIAPTAETLGVHGAWTLVHARSLRSSIMGVYMSYLVKLGLVNGTSEADSDTRRLLSWSQQWSSLVERA